MNREQVLAIAKLILYNTPMTQAVLEDRKTATRRLVKPQPTACSCADCGAKDEIIYDWRTGYIRCRVCRSAMLYNENGGKAKFHYSPYKVGDILYVRETWAIDNANDEVDFRLAFSYKASENEKDRGFRWVTVSEEMYDKYYPDLGCYFDSWRPSIFMPKEAARIFLKVTDVKAERLQDMTREDAIKEGAETDEYLEMEEVAGITGVQCQTIRDYFGRVIWDNTLKKADRDKYSWDANPWVWVIEFERIEVDE